MVIYNKKIDLNRPSTQQITLEDGNSDIYKLVLSPVLNNAPYSGTVIVRKNGVVVVPDENGRYDLTRTSTDGDLVTLKVEAASVVQDIMIKHVNSSTIITDEGEGDAKPTQLFASKEDTNKMYVTGTAEVYDTIKYSDWGISVNPQQEHYPHSWIAGQEKVVNGWKFSIALASEPGVFVDGVTIYVIADERAEYASSQGWVFTRSELAEKRVGKIADIAYMSDVPTRTSELTNDSDFAKESIVNDKINQFAAHYLTKMDNSQFATHAELAAAKQALIDDPTTPQFKYGDAAHIPDKNDYLIVVADETHDGKTARYSFVGDWPTGFFRYQYTINDTTFSQEQLDVLDSGITSEKVQNMVVQNDLNGVVRQDDLDSNIIVLDGVFEDGSTFYYTLYAKQ